MNELGYEVSGEQARPWIRYWARSIDLIVFVVLVMIVWIVIIVMEGAGIESLDMLPDTVLGIIIGFIYTFFEAWLLSTWGTTIGKALFKIRVLNSDGSKLSYIEGLKRSLSVWIIGQGMGIPIVTLIASIIAYNKLKDNGITSWDDDGGYVVAHQILGKLRATLLILIPIIILVLAVIVINEY